MYKSTFFTLEVLEPPESDDVVDVREKVEAELADSSVDERDRLLHPSISVDAQARLQQVLTVSVLDVRSIMQRGRHGVLADCLLSESEC
jgi:hypothetical protein